jgi:hypothetical protein
LGRSHTLLLPYCLWLLSATVARVETLLQRQNGLQSLNDYLLSPYEKCIGVCSRTLLFKATLDKSLAP